MSYSLEDSYFMSWGGAPMSITSIDGGYLFKISRTTGWSVRTRGIAFDF